MRVRAEKGLKGFPAGKKVPGKKNTIGLRRASSVSVRAEKGLKDVGTTLRYIRLSSLKSELESAFNLFFFFFFCMHFFSGTKHPREDNPNLYCWAEITGLHTNI